MFQKPLARTILRAVVVMILAACATLKASIGDGLDSSEWVDLVQNTIAAGAVYLGIGAAIEPVEPFFGNKMENVPVPDPPANPVPPDSV